MKNPVATTHENYPDAFHDTYAKTIFGFWVYLMTDFILFGALFATYAVLCDSTFGGPSAKDLFLSSFTLIQTLALLTCSLMAGLAGASAHRKQKNTTLVFFGLTFLLGAIFLGMMMGEFSRLIQAGSTWDRSAFLSAYFTIVGTHGLHVVFGLLWTIFLLVPVFREGVSNVSIRRLTCLRMFWQFLNVVWIFVFSFVYLLGVV